MTATTAPFFDDLFQIADTLLTVIHQETQALKARRVSAVAELGEVKGQLAAAFSQGLWRLKQNLTAVGQTDAGLRQRLAAMTEALRKAAGENALMLLAARDANQRLLDVVVQTAAKRRQIDNYGRFGKPAKAPHQAARPVSMFQDQQF
jgi:flagellar biosynthesis/type III secretory pathway chaperone